MTDLEQQVRLVDRTIQAELWYPRQPGRANEILVDLVDVRAAAAISIRFDFDRNGWEIRRQEWDEDAAGWRYVPAAFVLAEGIPPAPPADPTDWRTKLSDPPKPHTFMDMVELALDIASEDADSIHGEGVGSARADFQRLAGHDLYDGIRAVLAGMRASLTIDTDQEHTP